MRDARWRDDEKKIAKQLLGLSSLNYNLYCLGYLVLAPFRVSRISYLVSRTLQYVSPRSSVVLNSFSLHIFGGWFPY